MIKQICVIILLIISELAFAQPVPNVEELYIGTDGVVNSGDETLTAVQHAMPGLTDPYAANTAQLIQEHYGDKPFFVDFPFGYVANDVDWFEEPLQPDALRDFVLLRQAAPLPRPSSRPGSAPRSILMAL